MAGTFADGTDRIDTTLTAHNDDRTYACWTYRSGDGGFGSGRIFAKYTDTTIETLFNSANSGGIYLFRRDFNGGTNGEWTFPRPATSEWHHVAMTYNSTSVSNDPVMYLDGVSQTVTEAVGPPVGTAETATEEYCIGNRTDAAASINWDGRLCEFAVWDRILTAGEIASIGADKYSPLFYPKDLVSYVPMIRDLPKDLMRASGTNTGVVVVEHPPIIYPTSKQIRRFDISAAVATAVKDIRGVGIVAFPR